jgi:hypothetical protein
MSSDRLDKQLQQVNIILFQSVYRSIPHNLPVFVVNGRTIIICDSHDSNIYFPFYCFLIVVLAPAGKFNFTTLLYDIAQCVRLL